MSVPHDTDAGQSLREDWSRVVDDVTQRGEQARGFVEQQVDAHPLAAVGAAAGLGFLLGGGLTRQGLALVLGVGARMAAGLLRDELSDLVERASARDDRA